MKKSRLFLFFLIAGVSAVLQTVSLAYERVEKLPSFVTDKWYGKIKKKPYVRMSIVFSSNINEKIFVSNNIVPVAGKEKNWDLFIPEEDLEQIINKWKKTGLLVEAKDRLVPKPHDVEGEEISLFNCSLFWQEGYNGEGIKVAVIDGGFYGLSSAIAQKELPDNIHSVSFAATGVEDFDNENSMHGTAVAEIIHEIAPFAELYLVKVDSAEGLLNAYDYCVSKNIRIVNHSMGWYSDGWYAEDSFVYNNVVVPFYNKGILWINSAGNDALYHYQSFFRDVNSDGFHDFEGTNEGYINVPSAGPLYLYMNWNAYEDYYNNKQIVDYDLHLYNPSGVKLASSTYIQNFQHKPPSEKIEYNVPSAGIYRYKVEKKNSYPDREFQIFASHPLSPFVSSNSLSMPNEGEKTLTVGAVHWSNWTKPSSQIRCEPYSSRGPSKKGLIKPDLVGIDAMKTFTYSEFKGTSASAPSVTGLAALILSKQPYMSVYQLRYSLIDNCEDLYISGPDSETGYGRYILNLFPLRRNDDIFSEDRIIVAPTRLKKHEPLYYYGVSDNTKVRLKTTTGTLIKVFDIKKGVYNSGENFLDLSDLDLADGVYVLEFMEDVTSSKRTLRKIVITK